MVQRCAETWMSCSAAASLRVLKHPCIAMWSLHLILWGSSAESCCRTSIPALSGNSVAQGSVMHAAQVHREAAAGLGA